MCAMPMSLHLVWTSGKQIARFWEHAEKHIFLKSVAESGKPIQRVPFDGVFATGCDHSVPCCRPHSSSHVCCAALESLALVAAALEACCRRAWFTPWLASASEICAVVFGVLQLDKLLSMISAMVHGFCGTYFHSRRCVCNSNVRVPVCYRRSQALPCRSASVSLLER